MAKTTKIVKPQTNTKSCTMCGEEKKINSNNYYKSYSVLYSSSEENRIGVCKECVLKLAEQFKNRFSSDTRGLYELCKLLDVYYEKNLYESAKAQAEKSNSNPYQIYFQKVLSLPQNRDKVFLDSEQFDIVSDIKENVEDLGFEDKDLIKRWGKGFTVDDMYWLEEDYVEWTTHHDCDKLSVQRLVQMICIKELEIRNARMNGQATDKLEKSLMELMNNSNLTPRTMSAMNETDSTKVFGMWLKDIEQYRPAEYFQDKKLYDDYDGIMDYFNKFVLRPMKNLLTGTREFDKEFSVENDEVE